MNQNDSENAVPQQRLFLDKVGLQFPSWFLNGERYRDFVTGTATILKFGYTGRVMVHEERLSAARYPAEAAFLALQDLSYAGVFIEPVARMISFQTTRVINGWYPLGMDETHLMIGFQFIELELSIDLPGIEFLGEFDPKVFTQFRKTSFYSKKDHIVYRRGKGTIRSGKSRGKQKSFFKAYRKDLQIKLPYPVYRVELTYSGKYRCFLHPAYLFLPVQSIFTCLLPSIASIFEKLEVLQGVEFNPLTYLQPDSSFGQILRDISSVSHQKTTFFGD